MRTILVVCLLVLCGNAYGQGQKADTANKITIIIANTRSIEHMRTDSGEYTKFIHEVVLYQGTDTLYCDSLYQNSTTQNFEAFGNVRISQLGGTEGTCDYLRYKSAAKLAYMRGNVRLADKKSTLWCEELTYDLATKTGVYNKSGTLQTDSTTVSSNSGVYNVRSKESRFTGNVIVTDPRYKIRSEDLGYNTETKLSTFFSPSTVTSDSGKSVLVTTKGTYDGKNVVAHFTGHSSIWNDGQYIEADSMSYNKTTGFGWAHGSVVSIDTAQKSWLYCGHAEYYRKQRVLWATIKPVMVQANGKDTFYMRADTFYSAPMEKVFSRQRVAHKAATITDSTVNKKKPLVDSAMAVIKKDTTTVLVATWMVPATKVRRLPDIVEANVISSVEVREVRQKKKEKIKEKSGVRKEVVKYKPGKVKQEVLVLRDTAAVDTTAPLFFTGYHHVLIFSDSLQAVCDSVCYTRSDSMIRMMYAPIAWSRKSQITGDTILMKLDSSEIRYLYVPSNAFAISQSGPTKAHLFDQIQSKTLTAYFTHNEITHMVAVPNAESIYYSRDEKGAYMGVVESKSERMRIYFNAQQISDIRFDKNPEHKLSPLDKADLPNMKLSRFKWLINQRPKSKEQLFQ